MKRFVVVGACAVAFCALPSAGPETTASADLRALPMQFESRQGPREACQPNCRTWISATGAITGDTPREFDAFAKNRNIRGATLVLDSDGGSVLGALALGRAVRKLGMITTVGKTIELPPGPNGEKRAQVVPNAYCESMCAFVLLAGVERHVPPEARVLVHQIWLGDRRDDPTAANYSAEDLVLVQRDIGRLAQYTVEMGGAIDLLETALKIPPWEPMRLLSRDELRGMKIITAGDAPEVNSGTATATPPMSNGNRAALQERSWIVAENSGRYQLTRKHPLTVEGEEIGSFDLTIACGETGKDYSITYAEQRRSAARDRVPALTEVELSLSGKSVPLKIVSSRLAGRPLEFDSVARGSVPADLVNAFADPRSRSLMVETTSEDTSTAIRIGNAGVARSFQQLVASCAAQTPIRSTARTELRREAEAQPR